MNIIQRECANCGEKFVRTERWGPVSDLFCHDCHEATKDGLILRNKAVREQEEKLRKEHDLPW